MRSLGLRFADEGRAHRALLPRHRVLRWLRAALGSGDFEIGVRVVGEAEGLALNASHRAGDHATNVLTFAYAREPTVVADLVLCAPVIEREAADAGKALEAHYAHLVVHGALHASGFDHDDDADAARMEARETELLTQLGYPDPWDGPSPDRWREE
jgi:probable rRNA maturation factor